MFLIQHNEITESEAAVCARAIGRTFSRAALFDLDGVLIDTEGIYTQIWQDIEAVFPTGVNNFALRIKGNTLPHILNTYFAPGKHDAIREMLRASEDNMVYDMFPGVDDLLQRLLDKDYGIAIVTSSNAAKMRRLLHQLPTLATHVHIIVTDADVTESKPSPQGYLLAAKTLGCAPEKCFVFEDSFSGIEAGKRAGAFTVAIATTNPAESLQGKGDALLPTVAMFAVP